jgi:hypothetical protein
MTCNRCGRNLKREPIVIGVGRYGPVCARAITGVKVRRSARAKAPDERQQELALEAAP